MVNGTTELLRVVLMNLEQLLWLAPILVLYAAYQLAKKIWDDQQVNRQIDKIIAEPSKEEKHKKMTSSGRA
jgi:anthranilate phosphoribosyltransferase